MAFTLVRGTFHVKGFSPDGDSVRFLPDDPATLLEMAGPPPPGLALGKSVQLRLEAIDALETHYTSGALELAHQPRAEANGAADRLMSTLGIGNVAWDDRRNRVLSADDGVRGYVLARTFERNRRLVSFAFAGDPAEADGTPVFLDGDRLRRSVNLQLLAEGFVYPTYYRGMFSDLRRVCDEAARAARSEARPGSVWAIDVTEGGVAVPPFERLSERHAILPKLFRRISNYFAETGNEHLDELVDWLSAKPDACLFIPDANPSSLHAFVEVKDRQVRLTTRPENLLFLD